MLPPPIHAAAGFATPLPCHCQLSWASAQHLSCVGSVPPAEGTWQLKPDTFCPFLTDFKGVRCTKISGLVQSLFMLQAMITPPIHHVQRRLQMEAAFVRLCHLDPSPLRSVRKVLAWKAGGERQVVKHRRGCVCCTETCWCAELRRRRAQYRGTRSRLWLLQRPHTCSEVSLPGRSQLHLDLRCLRARRRGTRLCLLQRPQRCSEMSPTALSQRILEQRRPSMRV